MVIIESTLANALAAKFLFIIVIYYAINKTEDLFINLFIYFMSSLERSWQYQVYIATKTEMSIN